MVEHPFVAPLLTSADIAEVAAGLRPLGSADATPGEQIDQIRRLEELKSAAAAAQARVTARFAAGQRAAHRAAGVPADQVGKGISAQVALARRESPNRGGQHLGLAEALVGELPHTLAALQAGQISEWRATLVARETACLSTEHRAQVDAELAARPGGMAAMGDKTIAAEARRAGYRLDPHAVTRRAAKAAADRRVTLRPAPDAMTWFGALVPVAQGVAAYASLTEAADTARAGGDQRTRGQVMADTLVERLTGQDTAAAVPVQIHLVMTDQALLAGDAEPAELDGYGPLPAPLARAWLRGDDAHGLPGNAKAWLRRLYTTPESGALVAMESKQRCFEGELRRFLITADRTCRTPWCDAPIRHINHAIPAADGGPTSADNGEGLCEACNYTREAPGWTSLPHPGRAIQITTPTGHHYTTRPPTPVGQPGLSARASPPPPSLLEQRLRDILNAA